MTKKHLKRVARITFLSAMRRFCGAAKYPHSFDDEHARFREAAKWMLMLDFISGESFDRYIDWSWKKYKRIAQRSRAAVSA